MPLKFPMLSGAEDGVPDEYALNMLGPPCEGEGVVNSKCPLRMLDEDEKAGTILPGGVCTAGVVVPDVPSEKSPFVLMIVGLLFFTPISLSMLLRSSTSSLWRSLSA